MAICFSGGTSTSYHVKWPLVKRMGLLYLGLLLQHAVLVFSRAGLVMARFRLPPAHGQKPAMVAQVKEDQLQQLLRPAGFVWELTIPRKPDGAACR